MGTPRWRASCSGCSTATSHAFLREATQNEASLRRNDAFQEWSRAPISQPPRLNKDHAARHRRQRCFEG